MKKRLKISEIEVKSFNTTLQHNEAGAVKGGNKELDTLPLYKCLTVPQYTEAPFMCVQP